jgi:hypothetical protein
MTDTIQQVGELITLLALGGYTAWKAHKTDRQTKATGNGFAKSVRESLDRIEKKADATHVLMVEHLADHAGSDLSRRSVS